MKMSRMRHLINSILLREHALIRLFIPSRQIQWNKRSWISDSHMLRINSHGYNPLFFKYTIRQAHTILINGQIDNLFEKIV